MLSISFKLFDENISCSLMNHTFYKETYRLSIQANRTLKKKSRKRGDFNEAKRKQGLHGCLDYFDMMMFMRKKMSVPQMVRPKVYVKYLKMNTERTQ